MDYFIKNPPQIGEEILANAALKRSGPQSIIDPRGWSVVRHCCQHGSQVAGGITLCSQFTCRQRAEPVKSRIGSPPKVWRTPAYQAVIKINKSVAISLPRECNSIKRH